MLAAVAAFSFRFITGSATLVPSSLTPALTVDAAAVYVDAEVTMIIARATS